MVLLAHLFIVVIQQVDVDVEVDVASSSRHPEGEVECIQHVGLDEEVEEVREKKTERPTR